jgi:hypothetical protein
MYYVSVRIPFGPDLEVVEVNAEDCYDNPDIIRLVVYARKPGA